MKNTAQKTGNQKQNAGAPDAAAVKRVAGAAAHVLANLERVGAGPASYGTADGIEDAAALAIVARLMQAGTPKADAEEIVWTLYAQALRAGADIRQAEVITLKARITELEAEVEELYIKQIRWFFQKHIQGTATQTDATPDAETDAEALQAV